MNAKPIKPEDLVKKVKENNQDSKFSEESAKVILEAISNISEADNLTSSEKEQVLEKKALVKKAKKYWNTFSKKIGSKEIALEIQNRIKKDKNEALNKKSSAYLTTIFIEVIKDFMEEGNVIVLKNIGILEPSFRGGAKYHDVKNDTKKISELTMKYKLSQSRQMKIINKTTMESFLKFLENKTSE